MHFSPKTLNLGYGPALRFTVLRFNIVLNLR